MSAILVTSDVITKATKAGAKPVSNPSQYQIEHSVAKNVTIWSKYQGH